MKKYLIYYIEIKDLENKNFPPEEKTAIVKAEDPDKAYQEFYTQYTPPKYEATGFEELI